jgi:hypothetical protein
MSPLRQRAGRSGMINESGVSTITPSSSPLIEGVGCETEKSTLNLGIPGTWAREVAVTQMTATQVSSFRMVFFVGSLSRFKCSIGSIVGGAS